MNTRKLLLNCITHAGVLTLFSGCVVTEWMPSPQPQVRFQSKDYEDPDNIVEGPHHLYVLNENHIWEDPESNRLTERQKFLLTKFSPKIVHGYLNDEDHTSGVLPEDAIGEPELFTEPSDPQEVLLKVNTEHPTLFAEYREAIYDGTRLPQLIYSFWYPDHPKGGIQKGKVDGRIVRVTLDTSDKVIAVDTAMHCGCFHGIFVAETVEKWAKEEFGILESGAHLFSERRHKDRISWNVRGLLTGSNRDQAPVLYLSAGERFCEAIQFESEVGGIQEIETRPYAMKSYDQLHHMHPDNNDAVTSSMFGPEGLAIGGKRIGEEIFFPTMNHPGWPRSLDQVEIHWDQARFTDPYLFQSYLRIPGRCLTKMDPIANY